MNILYLNNEMTIGGVAKCVLKLSKGFQKDNKICIASKENGALLSEFERINIKNISINSTNNKSPINILKNISIIYNIVKKEDIDIIHSHHRMTTLLAKVVSKFTKVKVIHTEHLCINDKYKLTKLALSNVKVITVSNAAKRILIEKSKLKDEDITTIYNTIDTVAKGGQVDDIILRLKNNGNFIVAQISRVIDYKGVYDFIEVAKDVSARNNNIKFVLIGDGPELEGVKEKVKEYKLEDSVYILGSKNNVMDYLKYIDLVILCSYIEGLPLAPLEAFSQGVPVIATDIDGTNEEIINSYNGFLVKPKDIEGFSNAILKVYNNKNIYMDMKKQCKEIFDKKFSEKLYYSNHLMIYKQLLNSK